MRISLEAGLTIGHSGDRSGDHVVECGLFKGLEDGREEVHVTRARFDESTVETGGEKKNSANFLSDLFLAPVWVSTPQRCGFELTRTPVEVGGGLKLCGGTQAPGSGIEMRSDLVALVTGRWHGGGSGAVGDRWGGYAAVRIEN